MGWMLESGGRRMHHSGGIPVTGIRCGRRHHIAGRIIGRTASVMIRCGRSWIPTLSELLASCNRNSVKIVETNATLKMTKSRWNRVEKDFFFYYSQNSYQNEHELDASKTNWLDIDILLKVNYVAGNSFDIYIRLRDKKWEKKFPDQRGDKAKLQFKCEMWNEA